MKLVRFEVGTAALHINLDAITHIQGSEHEGNTAVHLMGGTTVVVPESISHVVQAINTARLDP